MTLDPPAEGMGSATLNEDIAMIIKAKSLVGTNQSQLATRSCAQVVMQLGVIGSCGHDIAQALALSELTDVQCDELTKTG